MFVTALVLLVLIKLRFPKGTPISNISNRLVVKVTMITPIIFEIYQNVYSNLTPLQSKYNSIFIRAISISILD